MENSFGERNRAHAARVSGLGGRTETELFVVHAAALRDAAALPATCFLQVHGAFLDFSSSKPRKAEPSL